MLRPPRKRDYGPHLARTMYRDASAGIRRLLDYASPETAPEPDGGEPSGPAGNGGAGPAH